MVLSNFLSSNTNFSYLKLVYQQFQILTAQCLHLKTQNLDSKQAKLLDHCIYETSNI